MPENLAKQITCGPSVEHHLAAVKKFVDAGFHQSFDADPPGVEKELSATAVYVRRPRPAPPQSAQTIHSTYVRDSECSKVWDNVPLGPVAATTRFSVPISNLRGFFPVDH
jgi:hypothetical protein